MIEIHINPARVERVVFSAGSEMEGDFDLAAWLAVRGLVNQIDRRLRAIANDVCESPFREDKKPRGGR